MPTTAPETRAKERANRTYLGRTNGTSPEGLGASSLELMIKGYSIFRSSVVAQVTRAIAAP
jgi:hypothetical protein